MPSSSSSTCLWSLFTGVACQVVAVGTATKALKVRAIHHVFDFKFWLTCVSLISNRVCTVSIASGLECSKFNYLHYVSPVPRLLKYNLIGAHPQ
ncbi:hypothetical protein B0H11DRAFT_2039225 [Mycena galericulata]|nr:hypothetical protein B0H11DRAFT_2039225 [Mycena galericulata]